VRKTALARWNPWRELAEVEREVTNSMRQWFEPFAVKLPNGGKKALVPAVDVLPRGKDLVIRAELPGIDPEKDVEITFEDGFLRIRGERRKEEKEEGKGWYRIESSYGAFDRTSTARRRRARGRQGHLRRRHPRGGRPGRRGAPAPAKTKKIPVTAGKGAKTLTE